MGRLEVLWAPLFAVASIAVVTFFPPMHQPLLRRETDLILVLIRPTAEALVSPGILRRRARKLLFRYSTSMYAGYVIMLFFWMLCLSLSDPLTTWR